MLSWYEDVLNITCCVDGEMEENVECNWKGRIMFVLFREMDGQCITEGCDGVIIYFSEFGEI